MFGWIVFFKINPRFLSPLKKKGKCRLGGHFFGPHIFFFSTNLRSKQKIQQNQDLAVDGWNPAPVEVGSLSHYLQGSLYIPGGCLGFLNHQQLVVVLALFQLFQFVHLSRQSFTASQSLRGIPAGKAYFCWWKHGRPDQGVIHLAIRCWDPSDCWSLPWMVNPPATQKAMSKLGLIYRLDWWPIIFNLYLDIYLYIFYGFWKFQSMFHLLFFFQFCWVESCSLVATNPTLSVPCEGCGHQSKSHRRKMQRRSVQRNQTVRVMWVSVVNSEITRFSVVQHVAFAVNNSKSHFCRNGSSSGYLHLLIS